MGWVEYIAGKGENAGYQYFLLFPSVFKSHLSRGHQKSGLCDKKYQPFPKQALVCMYLHYMYFENTVGKGEIAHNEQFLLFPQCFLPF